MGNMSYCRFQNTLSDLQECQEALNDCDELSEEEEEANNCLLFLCAEIVSGHGRG
jgi:hypothetical protein